MILPVKKIPETEQQLLDLQLHYSPKLTEWEAEFIENMHKTLEDYTLWALSTKQKEKINEIFERCDAED